MQVDGVRGRGDVAKTTKAGVRVDKSWWKERLRYPSGVLKRFRDYGRIRENPSLGY